VSEALRKRVITAAVLALALLFVLLALPAGVTVAVISLVVLMGAWEWSSFLRLGATAARLGYVGLIAVALAAAWWLSGRADSHNLVLLIALLWWLIALLWVSTAPRHVTRLTAAAAGVLALVPAWVALVRLRLATPDGDQWVLFALVLVWMADIGAYFVGRRFGRLRLAPTVSPAKTWEGALGGVLFGGVCALAGSAWFRLPLGAFLPLCLAAVGFSIVGDLTESLLKRFAGVKDSGTVFPGHGGVMDRFDSITGATPVLVLGLTLLGVVP
jgi:phosphatidate cytidylyltransferase